MVGAPDTPQPWHLNGLKLANELRAASPHLAKTRIAKAIAAQVQGAPTSVPLISRWLEHREHTGELPPRVLKL